MIVSKWLLMVMHHSHWNEGVDNFHQFIYLINYNYEGVSALGGLLAGYSCRTDD